MSSKLELSSKLPANPVGSPTLCLHGKRVASPVFEEILPFLEARTDGPNIALTCRAWRQLSSKCTLACFDSTVFKKIREQVREALWQERAGPGLDIVTPERFVAACHMRFARVRAIDLSNVTVRKPFGQFGDFQDIMPLFFRSFPGCVSFAYPFLEERWCLPERQYAANQARAHRALQEAFSFLSTRESLTTVDMSAVFMRAETIFPFVSQNTNLTSLTLLPCALIGDDEVDVDEPARQVQSIGCKLLGLRRLEIRTGLPNDLPQSLLTCILQGLPALETLSLHYHDGREDDVPTVMRFTSEPDQQVDGNTAKNKGLKRVEFTQCYIDQGLLQLFERSCLTPPQFSFNGCRFAKRLTFTMQLLRTTHQ